ncbi:uncharacterized protein [Henckelia pumila]|uniref:uncharacterized protein n=1 Tax=Henckelia pumila TaxID=405737 RepID=UPI003C6E7956
MLDAASGGVFVDKTPVQARNLIENMAANSQQFGTNMNDHAPRKNNEDHPNLRYGNPQANQPGPQEPPHNQANRPPYPQQQQRPQIPALGEFLENIVKDLATNTLTFQQETRASIQNLNTQMGQLATAVNRLEMKNSSSLPSQTMVNPKENVNAITLRSGRELKVHEELVQIPVKNEEVEGSKLEEDETGKKGTPRGKFPPLSEYKPIAPFPLALKESRKDEGIKGLYEIFRRCEEKYRVLQGPLNETTIVVQMADKSTIFLKGVIEDVLVQSNLARKTILKTSKSIIDVNNGTLTMEFDGEIVKFNIFDTLKISDCESVVKNLDVNDYLSQEHKTVVKKSELKEVMAQTAKNSVAEIFIFDLKVPKIETKLPPVRGKGMSKKKGRKPSRDGVTQEEKAETEIDYEFIQDSNRPSSPVITSGHTLSYAAARSSSPATI